MRKIYLTETQLNFIFKNTLLNEGIHKTANTRTFGGKIKAYLIPSEKKLQEHGLSLFEDPETVNELSDIADAIDAKEISINDFLDPDNFKDNEAYQLAMQWLKGINYRGENKYAEALANDSKESLAQTAKDREANVNNSLSTSEKIIKRNVAAKANKYTEYFNSDQFTLDALNFYNNWDVEWPQIDADNLNRQELNEILMPYFKKDPRYKLYMMVKEKCNELGQYAYDGDAVYTPIVGKPIQKGIGVSFGEKGGKKQIPPNWPTMFKFLREYFNTSALQITNSKPQCFFIKIVAK